MGEGCRARLSSTEPRFCERGEQMGEDHALEGQRSSTEPRFCERGEAMLFDAMVVELLFSSTEPRFCERGEHAPLLLTLPCQRFFNGAALL